MEQRSALSEEVLGQYLITEFEALQNRATQAEQIIASRTNFLLIVVTGALGAVFALAQSGITLGGVFVPGLFVALLLILTAGLLTLINNADVAGSTVILYRRMGRTRRWFVDHDCEVERYLPFAASDERPRFDVLYPTFRGLEPVIVLVNAVTAAVASGMTVLWLLNSQSLWLIVVLSTLSFGALVWVQVKLVRWRLRSIEREEQEGKRVHFPASR